MEDGDASGTVDQCVSNLQGPHARLVRFYFEILLSLLNVFYTSEYKLWTDATSREFIATHYPWFLPTFDAYTYPIQRADAIRYFVLYHFGGVYLDLDVGCLRSLDPLLIYPVILPRTIPVGVSNDLMFAEKAHPFMEQAIHNLVTFDHSYILNYPTVMFSTGPMFISAQFGLYTASHPPAPEHPGGDVRVLPKALYGKNAKPGEAPNSFFSHHYGSSWHADDAAFITFLGKWGKALMWLGLIILVIGITRLWQKRLKSHHGERVRRRLAFGRYDVVLPRAYHQDGRFHLDLGFVTVAESSSTTTDSSPTSSFSSALPSPSGDHSHLPVSFDATPSTPTPSTETFLRENPSSVAAIVTYAFHRARTWVRGSLIGYESQPRRRSNHDRGVMFFLPAILTPSPPRSPAVECRGDVPVLASQTSLAPQAQSRSRSPLYRKKGSEDIILSNLELNVPRTVTVNSSTVRPSPPPPPYEQGRPSSAEW